VSCGEEKIMFAPALRIASAQPFDSSHSTKELMELDYNNQTAWKYVTLKYSHSDVSLLERQ
jgi:hypothetical protein